jgi:CheY-like chemotaxis protein
MAALGLFFRHGDPMSAQRPRTYEILIVDDSEAEARLLSLAFAECQELSVHTSILTNTKDVTLYLRRQGKYSDSVAPDIIMLDYHMPTDGGAALAMLKGDPDCQCVPILVMTGVDNPMAVDDIYRRHANACFIRRTNLDELMKLAHNIVQHWLNDVRLPPPIPHNHNLASAWRERQLR